MCLQSSFWFIMNQDEESHIHLINRESIISILKNALNTTLLYCYFASSYPFCSQEKITFFLPWFKLCFLLNVLLLHNWNLSLLHMPIHNYITFNLVTPTSKLFMSCHHFNYNSISQTHFIPFQHCISNWSLLDHLWINAYPNCK